MAWAADPEPAPPPCSTRVLDVDCTLIGLITGVVADTPEENAATIECWNRSGTVLESRISAGTPSTPVLPWLMLVNSRAQVYSNRETKHEKKATRELIGSNSYLQCRKP